jgi:hypothetical protein
MSGMNDVSSPSIHEPEEKGRSSNVAGRCLSRARLKQMRWLASTSMIRNFVSITTARQPCSMQACGAVGEDLAFAMVM